MARYPVDQVAESLHTIRSVSFDLVQLGNAFSLVGNPIVAEDLRELANILLVSADGIEKANHDWLSASVREGQKAISKTFSAVMRGDTDHS